MSANSVLKASQRPTKYYLGSRFKNQTQIFEYLTSPVKKYDINFTQFTQYMHRQAGMNQMLVMGRCPRLAGASTLDDDNSDFTAQLNIIKKDESSAQEVGVELEMPEWVDCDEYGNPTRIQPRLVATRLSMDSLNRVSGAEYAVNTRLYDQMKDRETGEVDQRLVLDEFSDSFVNAFNDARKKMHAQLFDALKKDDILQQVIPDTGELFGTEYDFDSSVDVDPKYDYRLDPDQFDLRFYVDAASMPAMSRMTNDTVKYITKGEGGISLSEFDAIMKEAENEIAKKFNIPEGEEERQSFLAAHAEDIRQLLMKKYPETLGGAVHFTEEEKANLLQQVTENPEPLKKYYENMIQSSPGFAASYPTFESLLNIYKENPATEGYNISLPTEEEMSNMAPEQVYDMVKKRVPHWKVTDVQQDKVTIELLNGLFRGEVKGSSEVKQFLDKLKSRVDSLNEEFETQKSE